MRLYRDVDLDRLSQFQDVVFEARKLGIDNPLIFFTNLTDDEWWCLMEALVLARRDRIQVDSMENRNPRAQELGDADTQPLLDAIRNMGTTQG